MSAWPRWGKVIKETVTHLAPIAEEGAYNARWGRGKGMLSLWYRIYLEFTGGARSHPSPHRIVHLQFVNSCNKKSRVSWYTSAMSPLARQKLGHFVFVLPFLAWCLVFKQVTINSDPVKSNPHIHPLTQRAQGGSCGSLTWGVGNANAPLASLTNTTKINLNGICLTAGRQRKLKLLEYKLCYWMVLLPWGWRIRTVPVEQVM